MKYNNEVHYRTDRAMNDENEFSASTSNVPASADGTPLERKTPLPLTPLVTNKWPHPPRKPARLASFLRTINPARRSNTATSQRQIVKSGQRAQQDLCKLCGEHGWLRTNSRDVVAKHKTSYDVLTVSAEHGCDACTLLYIVLEPFTLNSVKPADIEFDPSCARGCSFTIISWRAVYDPWDGKDHLLGKQTQVYLFTDEAETSLPVL